MANRRHSSDTALKLIETIDQGGAKSQRALAGEAEVALGMVNMYVKRFIRKGWIKVVQVPARRYFYYVTPNGFKEKARLTAEYLSDSFEMFRIARNQCDDLLVHCRKSGFTRLALVGVSDFAEIAALSARTEDVKIAYVVDGTSNQSQVAGIRVVHNLDEAGPVDAVIVTDIDEPQKTFETLTKLLPVYRILTPSILRVNRARRFRDQHGDPK